LPPFVLIGDKASVHKNLPRVIYSEYVILFEEW